MCGICGIFHHGKLDVTPAQICRMRDCMYERGPDAAGYVLLPQIALGHRRLKIIDLSDAANQPMTNEDETIWVVFNGEIYNYRELRQELLKKGHQFKSQPDTEVIIHGYEQWGNELFTRLNGMYAIAIYDTVKNRLILTRDRVGKKPLYYTNQDGIIYFASDIKALFYTLPNEPEIDIEALDCFLHHIAVPEEHSIFQNISKVQPGTYQVFATDGQMVTTYWDWLYSPKENLPEAEILERCEYLLTQAILKRTISDVPLGIMLSGGVDSSIITAILSNNSADRIKTFTIGFKDYPLDDVLSARRIAKIYNTEHHEIMLDCNSTNAVLELVWQFGEPFGDSSAIPTYLVSKTAKEHVTVILTGDGGDEIFGGYSNMIIPLNAAIFKRLLPIRLHPPIKRAIEAMGISPEESHILGKILFYINYLQGYPYTSVYNLMGFHKYRHLLWNREYQAKLKEHNPLHPYHAIFTRHNRLHPIDQMLLIDCKTYLPYDYLVKIDRATMANSLECRSPFLDSELSDFTNRIDPLLKFKQRQTKYLLKKIGEKYLPKEILYTEKRGFGVPVDTWFSQNLKDYFERILFNRYALSRNYFDIDFIRAIWNEHCSGKYNHKHRLWSLFWLELWHLMFIEKIIDRNTPFCELIRIISK